MSTYNIKLEDKAAFINRLDKLGVGVESYEIKDDKLKGAFEFTVDDPVVDKIVKTILKQSPKINTIKEMEKITKKQLAEIIREELAAAKAKKKMEETQQLNEGDFWSTLADNWQSLLAIPTIATAVYATVKGLGKDVESAKQALIKKGMSEEDADALAKRSIYGKASKSLQSFGDK